MGEYVEPPAPLKEAPVNVRPWLIVVGASGSDGLRQLVAFVAALPADLPASVLAVLHRPADRVSALPKILQRAARLQVVTPHDGEILHPGVCYVADADHHLSVAGVEIRLVRDHVYRGRTLDLLFASAASAGGPRVVGVVLPGALRDGAKGLAAIESAGGAGFVIGGEWTEREGMPRAALAAAPRALAVESPQALAAAVTAVVRGR